MKARHARRPRQEQDAALHIVGALSEEIYLMSNQIAALGEALSTGCEPQISPSMTQQMQLFDTLCQRALTFARLLKGVRDVMSGQMADGHGHLRALIEEVPFEEERERLTRAIGGRAHASIKGSGVPGGELDLF